MQIKHLSRRELAPLARILPQCPEAAKTRLHFTAAREVVRYEATERVILDYAEGMSVLVLYRGDLSECYYFDRVIELSAGARFSVLPMGETCSIDIIGSLSPVDRIAAELLQSHTKTLDFEKIYTFLYQECSHNFYFRGERHAPYELVYVTRGELHNLVRGQDIVLGQQEFMIIDSGDWHTQFSDLQVAFLTVSFRAGDTALAAIANKRIAANAQTRALFEAMLVQEQQEAYGSEAIEALLKLLLISLLQDGAAVPAEVRGAQFENAIVDKAVEFVSENLQEKLGLEELAAQVHVSVPYLYKLFQAHLGTSPGKYIAKIRIEECKMLLREGHLSMGQIAERMGYSSLQHFSRQFRSICGFTPSEYLRSLR